MSLGVAHPELLAESLTWGQLCEWQAYYNEEPWGECRADQRAQAQTMWLKSQIAYNAETLPNMTFPYFETEQDIATQVKELNERKRELQRRATGGEG